MNASLEPLSYVESLLMHLSRSRNLDHYGNRLRRYIIRPHTETS
jgi:hypothetical protein